MWRQVYIPRGRTYPRATWIILLPAFFPLLRTVATDISRREKRGLSSASRPIFIPSVFTCTIKTNWSSLTWRAKVLKVGIRVILSSSCNIED